MDETEDLLPCPKCGADDLERTTHPGAIGIPLNMVLCITCGWGEPAERWNQRAPIPPPPL